MAVSIPVSMPHGVLAMVAHACLPLIDACTIHAWCLAMCKHAGRSSTRTFHLLGLRVSMDMACSRPICAWNMVMHVSGGCLPAASCLLQ